MPVDPGAVVLGAVLAAGGGGVKEARRQRPVQRLSAAAANLPPPPGCRPGASRTQEQDMCVVLVVCSVLVLEGTALPFADHALGY